MDIIGHQLIAADRATVWSHLIAADTLQACIPGCETITGSLDTGFDAVVAQKVGPLRVRFRGRLEISEIVPLAGYRIRGAGGGGLAGHAGGDALVRLHDHADGTRLSYGLDVTAGGRLARLGTGVIHGFAERMIATYFETFRGVVEAGGGNGDRAR